jgi:hypothetical protein
VTILGEYFSFLFWIYLGWLFLLISKWFRVCVPTSNEHQKTRCYSQAEIFCKRTAYATLLSECLWVLPAGKTNDAAPAERRACHISCHCKRQIVGCSLRSAHGKDSLKFGLFDKFIRIAIKLEKQDGGKILHSVA